MSKQQLYGMKILRPSVDQRSFCAAHSVGAICGIVEANRGDPAMHNPGVLPRRKQECELLGLCAFTLPVRL